MTLDLLNLDSAVVPVTGAASGMGLAICKRLRAVGATPLLLDFNEERLGTASREVFADAAMASRCSYLLDVRDSKAVDACFARIRSEHGGATHAVANAGIVIGAHVLEITDAQWHEVIDVNLHGVMYVCRAAARHLAERKQGAIVTMGSLAGLRARDSRIAYTSSKAAVINMTRALALDLAGFGIRVNAIAPGVIDTPIQQKKPAAVLQATREKIPMGRLGTADEVAKVALFLLSDLASYVTGETVVADGGLMAKYI
jgi:3-oxoacyl-[acyl-carrier protein] reductase